MKINIDLKKNIFGIHPKGMVYQFVLNSIKEKNEQSVMDFGCRNGDFLCELDKIGSFEFLYGVDLDKSAIELAKQKKSNAHFEHIKKNHVFDKSYNKRFDTITVIGVIEHIYDQDSVIIELSKQLKNEGLMIVAVQCCNHFQLHSF